MDSEVIAWLESPEGEEWSRRRHMWSRGDGGAISRLIALVTVKTWTTWSLAGGFPLSSISCELIECHVWHAQ
jgi:hypothetical protein